MPLNAGPSFCGYPMVDHMSTIYIKFWLPKPVNVFKFCNFVSFSK